MRLPEVAEALRDIAASSLCPPAMSPQLLALADEIKRRPAQKRAKRVSVKMTPKLAAEIRAYARANPKLAQTDIARMFCVNQGRVSEILKGKRR